LLPRGLAAIEGTPAPSDDGCTLEIDGPLVRVRGGSREAVFEHATRLLKIAHGGQGRPLAISAILHSPSRPSGFDRWSIIVGAEVAFSPTALDPWLPGPPNVSRIVNMRPVA
jgi:hypothetical protein